MTGQADNADPSAGRLSDANADQPQFQAKPVVDDAGEICIAGARIPFSRFASAEARRALIAFQRCPPPLPTGPIDRPGAATDDFRRAMDNYFFRPMVDKQLARYAVDITQRIVCDVNVADVVPAAGVAAEMTDKVLINLHGGAFFMGAGLGGLVESIPIAAIGGFRIITVDYRQAPEYLFPAASEDVARVYAALLQSYMPENVGIFGGSAGGLLTAQAVAWFATHDLPMPGAIGILASSASGWEGGDATYVGNLLSGNPPPSAHSSATFLPTPYLSGVDSEDMLAYPAYSPELLSRFPPSLFITGTRAFEMSAAVDSHRRFVKAGVDAALHVWDGVMHGFFCDPDIPESQEAYDVIVRHFRKYLGGRGET